MLKYIVIAGLFYSYSFGIHASEKTTCDFLFGTASAAYQIEGGWNTGGKGPSNWDYFTHNDITKYIIGKSQNGDVSTNSISRDVYLKDIQLMKSLGVNSYRFSISWARVMPDGVSVNPEGVKYYKTLVNDLLASGIKPVITLYHWDMPLSLYKQGGWANTNSPMWFKNYAELIFENLGGVTPYFITFNEPEGNIFTLTPLVENFLLNVSSPYEKVLSEESRARQANSMHHLLLANALVVDSYRKQGFKGKIGIALNLSPCIDPTNPTGQAAKTCNELHSKWILDALFKGDYPEEIKKVYMAKTTDFHPEAKEMAQISLGKPDFIGVNYYSPTLVQDDSNKPFAIGERPNPDLKPSYNGPVSPENLFQMLKNLDAEYNHPEFIITENGAGFGTEDEKVESNLVEDPLRSKYLSDHLDVVIRAKESGINVSGYLFWSLLDNFEWLWGYQNRFGLIRVDFNGKELTRTPKKSYYTYMNKISEFRKKHSCN